MFFIDAGDLGELDHVRVSARPGGRWPQCRLSPQLCNSLHTHGTFATPHRLHRAALHRARRSCGMMGRAAMSW